MSNKAASNLTESTYILFYYVSNYNAENNKYDIWVDFSSICSAVGIIVIMMYTLLIINYNQWLYDKRRLYNNNIVIRYSYSIQVLNRGYTSDSIDPMSLSIYTPLLKCLHPLIVDRRNRRQTFKTEG